VVAVTASPPQSQSSIASAIDPPTVSPAPPESSPNPTPTPEATPDPTPEPTPTDPPLAHGDPHRLYAAFLSRVNDDRSSVATLNSALTVAAQAQDVDAVHDASVHILDFVDSERDWLREHPPAKCYASAHKAARSMIAAYGIAAERFLDWSATGGGLAGLDALGKAADAAGTAGDKLTTFGQALEATSCPE
jgi:hypothetical protein